MPGLGRGHTAVYSADFAILGLTGFTRVIWQILPLIPVETEIFTSQEIV